jgi:dTDP-4-amino-4,6-dideoxygalactose transaminase
MPQIRTDPSPAADRSPAPLPLPSDQDATGRFLGDEEIAAVSEAIRSGTLTSTRGRQVPGFEAEMAARLGVAHVHACSSGSAAVHTAVAALDPEPGDEVVTTPITDMGAISAILFQSAVPVFCDVDPLTLNVTAETIGPKIGPRTRAIIVTHLFGNPCDMAPIMALAARHGIPVIEDCAQAFLARSGGRTVGTIGAIGAFSLQQGKHMTTGEGGFVATSDPALARRMFLFINKGWGYGDANPDHYFLAPNYRMSELQGAVARAQLAKLSDVVNARRRAADRMRELLRGAPGVAPPLVRSGNECVYWKFALRVDERIVKGGAVALGDRLKKAGIACAPRYIQKPAFACEVIRERRSFGRSGFPWRIPGRPERPVESYDQFPGTRDALEHVLVLPWNERYEERHIAYIARVVREEAAALAR